MDPWAIFTVVLMIAAGFVAFLPMIPGPALVWAIALAYAALNQFEPVGIVAIVVMTLLMIIGSLADVWTPAIGLQGDDNLSCGTVFVTTVGAIFGTFFVPVPLIGTLLGAAGAVALYIFYREGSWQVALRATKGVLTGWIAGFFVEFAFSMAIVMVFFYSVVFFG